jgi:uncharacterized protein YndB with AHSA1/START domain
MTKATDRLTGDLATSRDFQAPLPLVWKAWTEAEHLARWFGPAGCNMVKCTLDLRPGGRFHYGLGVPGGLQVWGLWTFREIVPPTRLVFVASFSDEAGGQTVHPMAPTWPREMLSTVSLSENGSSTTVTVTAQALNPTEIEASTFEDGKAGMTQGWGGTFDQLEAHLRAEWNQP